MITGVSNPSNDSITAYEFIDQGGGTGYFAVNGAAILATAIVPVTRGAEPALECTGFLPNVD